MTFMPLTDSLDYAQYLPGTDPSGAEHIHLLPGVEANSRPGAYPGARYVTHTLNGVRLHPEDYVLHNHKLNTCHHIPPATFRALFGNLVAKREATHRATPPLEDLGEIRETIAWVKRFRETLMGAVQ